MGIQYWEIKLCRGKIRLSLLNCTHRSRSEIGQRKLQVQWVSRSVIFYLIKYHNRKDTHLWVVCHPTLSVYSFINVCCIPLVKDSFYRKRSEIDDYALSWRQSLRKCSYRQIYKNKQNFFVLWKNSRLYKSLAINLLSSALK